MKTIVVAGDLVWDHNIVQYPAQPKHYHEPVSDAVLRKRAGGAWYLWDLLKLSCSDIETRMVGPYQDEEVTRKSGYYVSDAYMIWSLHEVTSGSKERVWRLSQFLGCQSAGGTLKPSSIRKDISNPDLLVLDDLSLGFCDNAKLWPRALNKGGNPNRVILKTSSLNFESALWKKLIKDFPDRLVVVLPVSAYREAGADVKEPQSWDLAIEETIREFQKGRFSNNLARCRRIIIHFGCAGAASFTRCRLKYGNPKSGKRSLNEDPIVFDRAQFERFFYLPEELEGAYRSRIPGKTFGASSILTAAMARHELGMNNYPFFVTIGRALSAMRKIHETGAGQPSRFEPDAAHEGVKKILHPSPDEQEPAAIYFTAFSHDAISKSNSRRSIRFSSNLLRDLTGEGLEYVAAKAIDVVIRGIDEPLKAVPKARYGNYMTVDREEIERINSIRNLIKRYHDNRDDIRPLSIAVFGPPGSGKSFAIKQLAAELFGAKKAIVEFNLSQFQSIENLYQGFHKVRDASVRGQIPLVFWDEFDSAFERQNLYWLKNFLAPMQDAEFSIGGISHPLGKAIFVFAGGTAFDFESFDLSGDSTEDGKVFRGVKGPDFVSRLRGYVNIKGPNPVPAKNDRGIRSDRKKPSDLTEEWARLDSAHLIRRAVLLRSILERQFPNLIDSRSGIASIKPDVIRGFLRVEKYKHGARSLETMVIMSDLKNARIFDESKLPSRNIMDLHVTSDFMDHVTEGHMETSVMEITAESCHEAWCKQKKSEGYKYGPRRCDIEKTHPMLKAYGDLSEKEKEQNRLTARLTQAKLLQIGYRIEKRGDDKRKSPEIEKFTKREQKILAEIEHDIWLRDHLLKGYEWAAEIEDSLFLHRDIAPFDDMPSEDMALDYAITNSVPLALWQGGYRLVKRRGRRSKF